MSFRWIPDVFHNVISLAGALVSAVALTIVIVLILIDFIFGGATLYLGLLTYIILPSVMGAGVVAMLGGAWRERRRRAKGQPASLPKEIRLDLSNSSVRRALVFGGVGGMLFLIATSVGTYKAYHVTESTAFCGTLCHTVMKPESTAHKSSSHARVDCVACHIGPGAGWFVKSKITGAYQLYAVAFNKFPRPIPTPIHNLRPARETCMECHWPEKFFGSRQRVNPHYLSDEANSPYPITLLVNVGGGAEGRQAEGIHWHMAIDNKVEYFARDEKRQEIAWVRVTHSNGEVEEYVDSNDPLEMDDAARKNIRTMDCIDCHNRPSHNYRSPNHSVNEAMALGRISTSLPYIKREAVKAMDADYADTAEAMGSIEAKITGFYQEGYPDLLKTRGEEISSAVEEVKRLYRESIFPEMKASWKVYPENIGHSQFVGCFRCHGSGLITMEGKSITKDCRACHRIMAQGPNPGNRPISPMGETFVHPVDIGGMEAEGQCTLCHKGGAEQY